MAKFDINKKGYDCDQVDNFINKLTLKYEEKLSEQKDRVFSLKNEISVLEERLESYKDKDKQISRALMFAVEKAEQIERKAKRLYDLEVKRLRLLYKQWEELIIKISTLELPKGIKADIVSFAETISEVLEQNSRMEGSGVIRKDLHSNSDGYIKNLLNRMDYAINSTPRPSSKVPSELSAETEKEGNRVFDVSGSLKSIKVKGKGNMADNYLNSDEEDTGSVLASMITHKKKAPKSNDSGFDLEDALNPKEDLDEIMKAFDFFIDQEESASKKAKK